MYQLLALILIILLLWVYSRWQWMKQYWTKRGIPQCSPHPILGSLTFLQKKNPKLLTYGADPCTSMTSLSSCPQSRNYAGKHYELNMLQGLWMRDIYNEHKGSPYVGIWVFWQPGLVVNCPDIARRILVKDSDIFRNRQISSGRRDPTGRLNLFTVNDPLWTSVRKRLNVAFTTAKLKALHELYHRKAMELVTRIGADTYKGVTIDLRVTFSDYTTDVIGEAAFGVISDATLSGDGPLRVITKEFMKYDIWRGIEWSIIFFLPNLVDIFGFTLFPKNSINYLRKIFRMIISQRGSYEDDLNKNRSEFIDALLNKKQEAADLSEDVLVAQAAFFLQAGFDTSSLTITYAIYELAFSPQSQAKLFEELTAAKQKLGDKEFDSASLAELTYLNCVINESLRKYPIMGWLDRVAQKEYRIDEKLTIKASTVIYVNSSGMQMDPDYFPKPDDFIPERFLPENKSNIPPFAFLPFGEGPRHCIGKRFGLNTVRYALALVILNFEVHQLPNTPKPNDCKVEKNGFLFMPGEPLSVKFVARK